MKVRSNVGEQLGIRWGGYLNVSGDKITSIAGDTAGVTGLNSQQ